MTPQRAIAHYEILSKIGEGGMGAVYRALDTKLNREVAIKVLPEAFAADPDRMARFQREAQMLAALNHPNIAAIYGIEQGSIVMELVEGADLKGPVPLETALDLARQIAAGLEAAHEKGIVHRDLKPANIKVTPDGRIKLLDFGLAKASEAAATPVGATQSPTLSLAMTQAGVILGTAAYMSPEQARGKPVDKRADIWAFGVILYELLTGDALFGGGETVSDALAAVIKEMPDLNRVPIEVRRLLRACLEKDPKLRLQSIGDWRLLLDEPPVPAAGPAAPARSRVWPAAAFGMALLAGIGGIAWWRGARPPEASPIHFSVNLPDASVRNRRPVILSPDGRRIVYSKAVGNRNTILVTRLLSEDGVTTLPGTENAADIFFSFDGQWIGFTSNNELRKAPIRGGPVSTVTQEPYGITGASWQPDGHILYAGTATGLLTIVPAAGGAKKTIPKPVDYGFERWPQLLPGGQDILFTVVPALTDTANGDLGVVSLADGKTQTIHRGSYQGRYLPSGHLVFGHNEALYAASFDLKTLRLLSEPVAVIEDLEPAGGVDNGWFDISDNGTLIYVPTSAVQAAQQMTWMEAGGKLTAIPAKPGRYRAPALSPDGRHLAYSLRSGTGDADLWVYDLARDTATQLTFNVMRAELEFAWAPDGKHLIYGAESAEGGAIWWAATDGSGAPERLLANPKLAMRPYSISPDGRSLVYEVSPDGLPDIWTVSLDITDPRHPKAGTPQAYVATPAIEVDPAFSPDGRWIAYCSYEEGPDQVYVRPFPVGSNGGGKFKVSTDRGKFPQWSPSGHELFYLNGEDQIMVVEYSVKGAEFEAGKPRVWSATPIRRTGVVRNFTIAPDGKRFLVFPRGPEQQGPAHVNVVLNFFEELRRKR